MDRAASLRNAEKLIRQGKLEAAIAEYVGIVEDAPRDWNASNTLGDLYARAGQLDKAIAQFNQIAESLSDEGAIAKASAVYKKILKLKPDHEHALLQVAELLAGQGLYADARTHLHAVIEQRRNRGDARGAAQARIRLGSLDPDDHAARRQGAAARADMGDLAGAVRDLADIATELAANGRVQDALEAWRDAAALDPADSQIRQHVMEAHLALGDFPAARACAVTVDDWRRLAAAIEANGHADDALVTLREAAGVHPGDADLAAELARRFLAAGDVAAAGEYLTADTAGDDPALRLALAEIDLRCGRVDEGVSLVSRLLEQDASSHGAVLLLGCRMAEQAIETGFRVIECASNAAVARADWAGAADGLRQFIVLAPRHAQALTRLVEIGMDGGLDATMLDAQTRLADAYLWSGAAREARFISEDLVSRQPWEMAHIDRLRRALVLLGEADPDRTIADRLSEESPFAAEDFVAAPPNPPTFEWPPDPPRGASEPETRPSVATQDRRVGRGHFELSANAIDLSAILGEVEPQVVAPATRRETGAAAADTEHIETENIEVDLSLALSDIKQLPVPIVMADPRNLDDVFAHLRGEVSQGSDGDAAAAQYARGLALRAAGDVDGAAAALRDAARAPGLRFVAASALARMLCESDLVHQAIDWFERAAQAPAPTTEDEHRLLYDFAVALENDGERARALAVWLELQAGAGSYRDVTARIGRLTLQAEG